MESQYDNDEKENWRKKLDLPQEMDINVVHWYQHLGETLLRLTYDALGFKLTRTLEVCNGCARSNLKARAVRNSS